MFGASWFASWWFGEGPPPLTTVGSDPRRIPLIAADTLTRAYAATGDAPARLAFIASDNRTQRLSAADSE